MVGRSLLVEKLIISLSPTDRCGDSLAGTGTLDLMVGKRALRPP